MKQHQLNRIYKYIREGEVDKLRYYLLKRKFNLDGLAFDEKRRNALHLACKFNHKRMVSFLLKIGLNPRDKDYKGNIPLITAIKTNGFNKIVILLIKKCPESFTIVNNDGICAKDILKQHEDALNYSENNERYTTGSREEELDSDDDEDDDLSGTNWQDKLHSELEDGYFQDWGKYEDDYYDDRGVPESHDEWADRISREFYEKQRASQNWDRPKRKREVNQPQKPSKRLLKEHSEQFIKQREELLAKKRRIDYEQICRRLFEESETVLLDHIPIPDEKFVKILLDCASNSMDKKNYLRKHQIQWHPDKFLQKCDHRLLQTEKEAILNRVKEISQLINVQMKITQN